MSQFLARSWMGVVLRQPLHALICVSLIPSLWCSHLWAAEPLGSAFTYQGRLDLDGSPYSGTASLRFALFDAAEGGAQVGNEVQMTDLPVADGVFQVILDFGLGALAPRLGNVERRFLEITVLDADGLGGQTVLSPRQELTAAPFALTALNTPRMVALDDAPLTRDFSAANQTITIAEFTLDVEGPSRVMVTLSGSWRQTVVETFGQSSGSREQGVLVVDVRLGDSMVRTRPIYHEASPVFESPAETQWTLAETFLVNGSGSKSVIVSVQNKIPRSDGPTSYSFQEGHVGLNAASVMVFPAEADSTAGMEP